MIYLILLLIFNLQARKNSIVEKMLKYQLNENWTNLV